MANKKAQSSKQENDKSTKLEDYKRDKKTLTPPLASLPNAMLTSWTNDRMPDMLWAVLIRQYHPGTRGYAIFRDVLGWLQKNKSKEEIGGVTHTDISSYSKQLRQSFISYIVKQAGTDALKPILLFKDIPAYGDWKKALESVELDAEESYSQLASSMSDVMFHQTQEATDARWVRLMGSIIGGKLHMPMEMIEKIFEYPDKHDQRYVRPLIRSSEMTTSMSPGNVDDPHSAGGWPAAFWKQLQDETVCIPEVSNKEGDVKSRYKKEAQDKKYYNTTLPGIRESLLLHFMETSSTTGVDPKHEAVFGLALYALDVFIENVILTVGATSSGRVNTRIILESYVTLKYLAYKEKEGDLLWSTYRDYGSGQISLVDRKYKEEGYVTGVVDLQMVDHIANEDKWQEYVPINLGNWDASDLRTISMRVGEKELYDKYYPYTSGYIHANWGAVREASFQMCLNPLHRMHRIPKFGLPVLPNSTEDCRYLVNKIFDLVEDIYPSFKDRIEGVADKSKDENIN